MVVFIVAALELLFDVYVCVKEIRLKAYHIHRTTVEPDENVAKKRKTPWSWWEVWRILTLPEIKNE